MSKNTIAILFEKKLVSYCSFVFIPINYIEGEEKGNCFVSNTEQVYENIKNTPVLFTSEQYLYGYPTNLEEIKTQFGVKTKREALGIYLESFKENIIIGNVNCDDTVSMFNINPDCLEDMLFSNEKNPIETTNNNVEKEGSFGQTIKEKVDLGDYKTAISMLKEKENKSISKKEVPNIILPSKRIDVKQIIKNVNKNVIDQEEAVDIIATTIAANHMTSNPRNHSNFLINGPTGVGKTEIISSIAKEIEIPFVVSGMESITQEGYVGRSVDTLIAKVYKAANNNLELAQRGVLALDEIDKKASQKNEDVAGRAVLNSLLKMLDGNVIDVNIGTSQAPRYITFDTSHLTIISIGAFAGLKEKYKKQIGFLNNNQSQKVTNVEPFFDYGIPEEYMGRQGAIVTLNELGFDNYIKILYKSCNSPLKIKKEFLSEFGVLLKTDESFINEIASKTVGLKVGARGLKKTINESLQPAITEILKEGKYSELIVNGETVNNPKQYILR